MISRSKDGDLIAGVANRTGWHTARGSSSRGGQEALALHDGGVRDSGEIEEMASHDELMAAHGFYYALYMSQFKGKGPGGDPDDIALDFVST